jgi:hypothetical protein
MKLIAIDNGVHAIEDWTGDQHEVFKKMQVFVRGYIETAHRGLRDSYGGRIEILCNDEARIRKGFQPTFAYKRLYSGLVTLLGPVLIVRTDRHSAYESLTDEDIIEIKAKFEVGQWKVLS